MFELNMSLDCNIDWEKGGKNKMKSDLEIRKKFQAKEFPRSAKYDPYWVHKREKGPNVL